MSFSALSSGENVLFVAPATVDQSTFVQVKSSAQDQVGPNGNTAFEVFDRVAEGKEFHPLTKSMTYHVDISSLEQV
jgi:hypothetical protein